MKASEDEVFRQMEAGRSSYSVIGNFLIPNTTNEAIARSQFQKALEFVPLADTVPLQDLRGSSYLYAVLMDRRIRRGGW